VDGREHHSLRWWQCWASSRAAAVRCLPHLLPNACRKKERECSVVAPDRVLAPAAGTAASLRSALRACSRKQQTLQVRAEVILAMRPELIIYPAQVFVVQGQKYSQTMHRSMFRSCVAGAASSYPASNQFHSSPHASAFLAQPPPSSSPNWSPPIPHPFLTPPTHDSWVA
jgi:hypothetical protein